MTLDSLVTSWDAIVAGAKERSPLLGTVLEQLRPVAVEGKVVRLSVGAGAGHMLEGARRQQSAIAELLVPAGGEGIVVQVIDSPVGVGQVECPKRLSETELRSIRLRELRAKDPALDAAAEALDLEIAE